MQLSRRVNIVFISVLLCAATAAGQATGKNPVIIIPGLTGTEIVDREGKKVWFSIHRGKADDLRLPMTSPVLSRNRDTLRPGDVIRKVDLKLLPDIEVYQSVIDALESKGYQEGNWSSPKASDVYYVFPYDWRRDNVESARLLMQRMAQVKRRLRAPGLKFDIIAHSMGGLIARYAAMYGAADLPVEGALVPTWAGAVHINKLMMFGTPNEGSFSAFDALLNGQPVIANRKLPLVDDFRAEDVMTIPSVYQLLPHTTNARFLDGDLQSMAVDIYDPEIWMKYGWGALSDPKFLGKLKDAPALARTNKEIKPKPYDGKGNLDDRLLSQTTFAQARAFFASALRRAKRFSLALDAVSKKDPIQLYVYGGNCTPTLDGAVILRDEKNGAWKTILDDKDIKTSDGKEFKKDAVKAAIYALGDGRVTVSSLIAGPVADGAKIEFFGASYPLASSFFGCGSHTKLFLEKPIQDSFLSALVVAKQAQP